MLLTDNIKAEKAAGASVEKMRLSTFRKAFDLSMDGDSGDGVTLDEVDVGGGFGGRMMSMVLEVKSLPRQKNVLLRRGIQIAINELIDLVD